MDSFRKWLRYTVARLGKPTYSRSVGIARKSPGWRTPLQPPPELARYAGLWVATKDGKIIATASSSRELVHTLAKLGPAGHEAVVQRVPSREAGIVVGMG